MLISLLIIVLSCPDMVMVYAFNALLQGVLVNCYSQPKQHYD